ncbi:hypothetical protein F4604DRAFT_1918609 [Suillus subluteus]|nr:hypothetical protein F4604DRAFT_1918609 [Suillus subluteus]
MENTISHKTDDVVAMDKELMDMDGVHELGIDPLRTQDGTNYDSDSSSGEEPAPKRPIVTTAYQIPDEPRTNEAGEMICDYPEKNPECAEFVVTRKFEWKKHMDKHIRPYKCQSQKCKKLKGFTYSGGLTRHMKDVHGEGKVTLRYCPESGCPRHSKRPFKRKENFKEHMRRAHEIQKPSGVHSIEAASGSMPQTLSTSEIMVITDYAPSM